MELRRKFPGLVLLLCCYGAGLFLFLAVHMVGFVQNRLAYADGSLAAAELGVNDFALQELEERDSALVTLGSDPQLVLLDAARRVENVVFEAEHTRLPGAVTAFWAKEGQPHTLRQMAYAQSDDATFYLPAAGGQSFRLDPGTVPGDTITIRRIAINQPRPFWAFFVPRAGEVALFAVVPGLAACVLSIVGQGGLFARFANRKRGAAHG